MSDRVMFKIGGRSFITVPQGITAAHRLYLVAEIAACGLDKARDVMAKGSSPGEGAYELLIIAARSGRLPWLVAGVLAEVGTAWSTVSANRNAEWFAGLTEPGDLAAFDVATIATLVAFTNGLAQQGPHHVDLSALHQAMRDSADSSLAPFLN
jgi:hypothetical protein